MDKVIGFELSADMAFFRRGYTTTSTLTYSFPPKTVISGLLAGVLGKQESEYREVFNTSSIALVIASPLRKLFMKQNLLYTKGSPGEAYYRSEKRLQVPFHYILHPRYRIYFYAEGDIYDQLKYMLENRYTVYTPYLGVANCLANITYLGEFGVSEKEVNGSSISIDSIIPLDVLPISSIDFNAGNNELRLVRERVPISMDNSRVVLKYSDIIFVEPLLGENGVIHLSKLTLTKGKYWQVSCSSGVKENVIFF